MENRPIFARPRQIHHIKKKTGGTTVQQYGTNVIRNLTTSDRHCACASMLSSFEQQSASKCNDVKARFPLNNVPTPEPTCKYGLCGGVTVCLFQAGLALNVCTQMKLCQHVFCWMKFGVSSPCPTSLPCSWFFGGEFLISQQSFLMRLLLC